MKCASRFQMSSAELCHSTVSAASEHGCHTCLTTLLERGGTVDGRNNLGWRPIHVAAQRNHLECVKVLLAHQSCEVDCPSFEDQTPLMLAVRDGHFEVCKALLEAGASANACDSYKQSTLTYAITSGRAKFVQLLCDNGADTNIMDYSENNMLNLAAEMHDVESIRILLENGAKLMKVTPYGFNPLMSALGSNNTEAFDYLLDFAKKNCTLEEIHDFVNYCDNKNMTPLTPLAMAARMQHPHTVDKLLECGANPNARKCLTIFWALDGHIECLKRLLPPVTNLADLELARMCQHKNSLGGILLEAARSDLEIRRCDGSRPGDRLKLLLDSGLHSVINTRRTVNFVPPVVMRWSCKTNGPRSLQKMFGDFMTPMTQMVLEGVHERNIKLMLEYGATWKGNYERVDFATVPPHFFVREPSMIELLGKYFDMNIYHPSYTFNLSILPVFFYPPLLEQLLKSGAECRSCLVPLTDVSSDAWTFERLLYWLKAKKNRVAHSYDGSVVHLSQLFDDEHFLTSFKILLEYTYCGGQLYWVVELIDNMKMRSELSDMMSTCLSLKHICRISIRETLRNEVGECAEYKTAIQGLELPHTLVEFLL